MTLRPDGNVSPCCYNFGIVLGNLKRQNLEAIWNGTRLQKLRQEFIEGKPRSCKSRIHNLNCHLRFQNLDLHTTYERVQRKKPIKLDLRLGGQCNLRCIMCDVWQEPNGVYDQTSFWSELETGFAANLMEVEVLGGEPFIQKDTYRLISLVEKINPDVGWSFVTNGHFSFRRVEAALNKIKILRLQLSVDAVSEPTFNKVRIGGDFRLLMKNLHKLHSYQLKRKYAFCLSFCVNQLNWFEQFSQQLLEWMDPSSTILSR